MLVVTVILCSSGDKITDWLACLLDYYENDMTIAKYIIIDRYIYINININIYLYLCIYINVLIYICI